MTNDELRIELKLNSQFKIRNSQLSWLPFFSGFGCQQKEQQNDSKMTAEEHKQ
jgi:hypothetical protein